jgi:Cytochrome c peroxidase
MTVKALPLSNGHLPAVTVPADNPQTEAKIRLGRQLYFDPRLSSDNTVSCVSCHKPEHGWADTGPVSEGVNHAKGGRNSPSVLNAAYSVLQFWDGRAMNLEKQAVGPIQNPVEMQMTMEMAIGRLKGIPGYVSQFKEVFGTEPNEIGVAKAIAAFERTVVQIDTPYDHYLQGDRGAMSSAAVRGMKLFNGKGHCTPCHSGPYFSDGRFHNLGAGFSNGKFADEGRTIVTKAPRDLGAFKTPGLRGVAETAPYLHGGSEPTLEAVIDLYDRGGIQNSNLDRAMVPLNLTDREKHELVEFLKALSGPPLVIEKPELPE